MSENTYHVLPEHDIFKHKTSIQCFCKPTIEKQWDKNGLCGVCVTHNACDTREFMKKKLTHKMILNKIIQDGTDGQYFCEQILK